MKKTIPHILENTEELIRNRRFEEALSELGGIDIESISPDAEAFYKILLAETNLYLGNYKIENIIDDAISFYRGSADTNEFARAKFLKGWLLSSIGRSLEAKEVLLESFIHYKRCENYFGQARALNHLGYTSYTTGDLDSALTYLEKCIRIYNEINDDCRKSSVLLNYSHLLFASGNLLQAIDQYKSIESLILNRGNASKSIFYYMAAVPIALKGDINKAKQIIKKTTQYFEDYPREKAIYYENLGWIHLLDEEYEEAEKALLKGLEISMEIAPKSALVSQIKRRLADAYLGMDNYGKAQKFGDEALAVAEKINERVEIAACYRVFAQLDCKFNNNDTAREWFKKAIDLFAMIGSRYELAATRYIAAISGLYHDAERQALLYLAREYFVSEDVQPYIEKINDELKRVRIIAMPRAVHVEGEAPKIIAVNSEMKRLVELAKHIAPSKMTVLLTGPTGSGKDLFASFIHHYSGRKGKFIAVNAAAIPDNMIESELFGYKKGAYTGADQATTGIIEEAEGGTFYLNEVADASSEMQAKLLDVLETRTVRRLGERANRQIDFRVIAATNHDLEELIRENKFRPDLYHRLKEIPMVLPSLNDRAEDIPKLLEHFLELSDVKIKGRRSEIRRMAKALLTAEWPGNIRELKAEVERLALIARGNIKLMADIAVRNNSTECEQLLALLERTNWNRSQVAKILGLSEGTVRHRIKKYDLSPNNNS